MKISQLIESLGELWDEHGDLDVAVWQYGGGLEDLCNVKPVHVPEHGVVAIYAPTLYDPPIRR